MDRIADPTPHFGVSCNTTPQTSTCNHPLTGAVLGLDILYFMTLAYLLWQDDTAARELVQYLDPSIDKPAPERSYGQDCEFTLNNIYHGFFDLFALAHFVGWFGKAVILRDFWFCTVLSVMFEIVEMSLSHQIQNFQGD